MRTLLIFFGGIIWFIFCLYFTAIGAALSFIFFCVLVITLVDTVQPHIKKYIPNQAAYAGYFSLLFLSFCGAVINNSPQSNQEATAPAPVEVKQEPVKTDSNPGITRPANPIEFEFFDHESMVKLGKIKFVAGRMAPLKVANYNKQQIEYALQDAVFELWDKYPDADTMTIWFFDREQDYDNGMPFTLGMVEWVPPESNGGFDLKYNYSDKANFKFIYSTCKKGESKIPSEMAYEVTDYFFQTHIKNEGELNDDQLLKITGKHFDIPVKKASDYVDEVNFFNVCETYK